MSTKPNEPVPANEDQTKRVCRLINEVGEEIVRGFYLDESAAQRLIEQGDKIRAGILKLLTGLAVTDEFADEEVESKYDYLSGYERPWPIADQMTALKAVFPQLESFDLDGVARHPLLPNAEGVFLIPLWESIAATYNEAVQIVLTKLGESYGGRLSSPWWDDQIGPDRLRQTAKKAKMLEKLREEQKGHDVLLVNAQFGLRHRGRSVRRARVVMDSNEVGLGVFEVGIMLLIHADRLINHDDLWIDCGGDEYSSECDDDFCRAPYFGFNSQYLELDTGDIDFPSDRYGSASAFVASAAPSK